MGFGTAARWAEVKVRQRTLKPAPLGDGRATSESDSVTSARPSVRSMTPVSRLLSPVSCPLSLLLFVSFATFCRTVQLSSDYCFGFRFSWL
jgi:hypothetical protein